MNGFFLLLLCTVIVVGLPVTIFLALRMDYRVTRQMKIDLVQDFQGTLEEFQINSYEVLVERTSHGHSKRVSEVYRIFFDEKGQYYLYQYVSGHRGVLKPLDRERALLAAGTDGSFKV